MSLATANLSLLARQSQPTYLRGGVSLSEQRLSSVGQDSLGKEFVKYEKVAGSENIAAYKNAYKADVLAAKPGEPVGRANRDALVSHLYTKSIVENKPALSLKPLDIMALDKVLAKDPRTQDDIKVKQMSMTEYLYEFVRPAANGVATLSNQAYDALTRASIFSSESSSSVQKAGVRGQRLLYVPNQLPEQSTLSFDYYNNTQVLEKTLPVIQPKLVTLMENNPTIFTDGATPENALYDSLNTNQRNLFALMAGQNPTPSNVNAKLSGVLQNSYNVASDLYKYIATVTTDLFAATNDYRVDTQNKVALSQGTTDLGPLSPTFANGYTGTLSADSTVKISQGGSDNTFSGTTTFVLGVSDGSLTATFTSTGLPASIVGRALPCTLSSDEPYKLVISDAYTSSSLGIYQGFNTSTPGNYVNGGTIDLSANKAVLTAYSSISDTEFTCTQALPSEFGSGKTYELSGTSASAALLPSSFSLTSLASGFQTLLSALRVVPDQTVYINSAGSVVSAVPSDGTTTNAYKVEINTADCGSDSLKITSSLIAQGSVSPSKAQYDPGQLLYVAAFDSSANNGTFTINGVTKSITIADGETIQLYDPKNPSDGFGVDGTLKRTGTTFQVEVKATVLDEKTQSLETSMQTQADLNTKLGATAVGGFLIVGILTAVVCCLWSKVSRIDGKIQYRQLPQNLQLGANGVVDPQSIVNINEWLE